MLILKQTANIEYVLAFGMSMTSVHFILDGCCRHSAERCKICIRKGLGLRINGLGLILVSGGLTNASVSVSQSMVLVLVSVVDS